MSNVSETMTTVDPFILDLSDDVLLKVIKNLNFFDVLELSHTCTRLMKLTGKRIKSVDLTKSHWNSFSGCTKFSAKEMLTWVGPHILELKLPMHIDISTHKIIMHNCKQLESLELSYIPYEDNDWKQWIKELNLKRLSLHTSHNLSELFDAVTKLKTLQIIDRFPSSDVWTFIAMNSNIERLSIRADYYGFRNDILLKLSRLQSLKLINIKNIEDLLELQNHVKMDQLREFTIDAYFELSDFPVLNQFLNILSEQTNLHSLTIKQRDSPIGDKLAEGVIGGTFNALTSLNLVSLTLDVVLNLKDFIALNPSPTLKYLNMKRPLPDLIEVYKIVSKWNNLENFCIGWKTQFITKIRIRDLLQISTSRPNCMLLFDQRSSVFLENCNDKIVGIEICFENGTYRVARESVEEQIGMYFKTSQILL